MEKTYPENKIFGIPRPLAGGLIGILIFLLILLPLKYLDYNSTALYSFTQNLQALGRITILVIGLVAKSNLPRGFASLLSIAVSTLPAGIFGMQIASSSKSTRRNGLIYAAVYLVFIMACGTLMTLAGI